MIVSYLGESNYIFVYFRDTLLNGDTAKKKAEILRLDE